MTQAANETQAPLWTLDDLRARYYDPEVGRFLNEDPLPLMQRYTYVGNNPANYVDPRGLLFHGGFVDCVTDPIECGEDVGGEIVDGIEIALPYISTGVQVADIVPWGAIPFANILTTPISVALDVTAFGFSLYDVWTSSCSFKQNIGLSFNSTVNLGVGLGGQGLAVLASPTFVGSAAISVTTSAAEASLFAANELAINKCEKEQRSKKE